MILQNKFLTVITTMALLVVLLIGFSVVFEESGDAAHHAKCKTSVAAYSKLLTSGISGAVLDPKEQINCPVRRIDLSGEAKKEIADEMFHCWDNYGKGKLTLFSEQEKAFCGVCSIIEFKDTGKITGMKEFLEKEKSSTGIPYLEFITGVPSDANADISSKLEETQDLSSVDRTTNQAVIFYHVKGKDRIGKFFADQEKFEGTGQLIGGGVSAAGGALAYFGLVSNPIGWVIFGAGATVYTGSVIVDFILSEPIPSVSLVQLQEFEPENLNQICDVIPVRLVEDE